MNFDELVDALLEELVKLLPKYLADPADFAVNQGNVALCAIAPGGEVRGKMIGTDKVLLRETAQIAWRKASQVWLTGYATGRYEELVYSKQVEWWKFGIGKPDFVGWDGGIPVDLGDGTTLSLGFSGFRGEKDVEILEEALKIVRGE